MYILIMYQSYIGVLVSVLLVSKIMAAKILPSWPRSCLLGHGYSIGGAFTSLQDGCSAQFRSGGSTRRDEVRQLRIALLFSHTPQEAHVTKSMLACQGRGMHSLKLAKKTFMTSRLFCSFNVCWSFLVRPAGSMSSPSSASSSIHDRAGGNRDRRDNSVIGAHIPFKN